MLLHGLDFSNMASNSAEVPVIAEALAGVWRGEGAGGRVAWAWAEVLRGHVERNESVT